MGAVYRGRLLSNQFIGEIRLFSYTSTIPAGWHICDGTILPINQYQALYSLLGTQFGGNGTTTFALPDLRGRVPVEYSNTATNPTYLVGATGGSESVVLTTATIPAHTHQFVAANNPGTTPNPAGELIGAPSQPKTPAGLPQAPNIYLNSPTPASLVGLNAFSITPQGGGQAHENRQPFQVLQYAIAMTGVYPPRP